VIDVSAIAALMYALQLVERHKHACSQSHNEMNDIHTRNCIAYKCLDLIGCLDDNAGL